MAFRIAAFLGNPGREYEKSRHNLAWMVLESLPTYSELSWSEKFKGVYARMNAPSGPLIMLKPHTFMNRSGESVGSAMRFFKADAREILVVHDDIELAFGEAQYGTGGGTRGHNGLKSIAAHVSSPDFSRFRLGVGRPPRGDVSSFVLSRFSPDEEAVLDDYVTGAAAMLHEILTGGAPHGQARVRLV